MSNFSKKVYFILEGDVKSLDEIVEREGIEYVAGERVSANLVEVQTWIISNPFSRIP